MQILLQIWITAKAQKKADNFESATVTEEITSDNIEVVHMDFHYEDRGNEINDEDIEEYIEEQNAPNIECKECRRMKMQMVKLQRCLQVVHLTEETMERDDKKVKYNTGLPNLAALQLTVQFVIEHKRKELQKVDCLSSDSTGKNEAKIEL